MKIIDSIDELKILANEIIEWYNTGILKDGKVRELAKDLGENWSIPPYESLRVAESIVNMSCLKKIVEIKGE